MGLRNLFVDVVSIDQSLTGDRLTEAVLAFSRLYESLPVMAAYDEIGAKSFLWTMRRLWILREVRSFRTNPNKVVYVGHLPKQGAEKEFGFVHMVDRIWSTTFTHSILYLLCGQIGMTAISDLRFIMSEHAQIISAAYARMSRNDYLLTAAVLAQVHAPEQGVGTYRVNGDQDVCAPQYERYSLVEAEGGSYDSNKDILLDGRKIATWLSYYNMYQEFYRNKLLPEPDAERTIFESLGLSDAEYCQYAAREAQRREVMHVAPAEDKSVPAPEFEVVFVNL